MSNKYSLNKNYIIRKVLNDYIFINKKGCKEFFFFDDDKSKYFIDKILKIENLSIDDSLCTFSKEEKKDIELLKKELLRARIIKKDH